MRIPVVLWVGAGAALGSLARVATSLLLAPDIGFPLATLVVNVIGSFIIGWFAAISGPDGRLLVSASGRQFVMVGICGGLTTFSIFSLESLELLLAGQGWRLSGYLLVSLAGWLFAVWAGYAWGMRFSRQEE